MNQNSSALPIVPFAKLPYKKWYEGMEKQNRVQVVNDVGFDYGFEDVSDLQSVTSLSLTATEKSDRSFKEMEKDDLMLNMSRKSMSTVTGVDGYGNRIRGKPERRRRSMSSASEASMVRSNISGIQMTKSCIKMSKLYIIYVSRFDYLVCIIIDK